MTPETKRPRVYRLEVIKEDTHGVFTEYKMLDFVEETHYNIAIKERDEWRKWAKELRAMVDAVQCHCEIPQGYTCEACHISKDFDAFLEKMEE